jgi:hypothetical protein
MAFDDGEGLAEAHPTDPRLPRPLDFDFDGLFSRRWGYVALEFH